MPPIMQGRVRWLATAERGCLAIFFVWLAWLPLPFGSVVEAARRPLVAVPLALGAVACLIRFVATRDRASTAQPTRAWLVWGYGTLLFCAVGALQLIPLPASVLNSVSPESYRIWTHASRVASLAGVPTGTLHPVSVDPRATTLELFRLVGLFATFLLAALLIRNHTRRMVLISFAGLSALFQMAYGVHEAALGRYAIWGWPNRLIHGRVTGTFVNPNHFAHYVALAVPLALFVAAMAWRETRGEEVPLGRRLVRLFEHHIIAFSFGILTAIACVAAVLLAQSRGALLALAAGLALAAALLPQKKVLRIACAAAGGLLVVVALVVFLGTERTVARFAPNEFERATLVGRKIGVEAAVGVWNRFPILGSGLGTFERVVSMEQTQDLAKMYHHAHNDYAEIAATAGTLGIVTALVTLIGGYVFLVRLTRDRELSWKRRAFQLAALASLTIALVHALFDFNFFIPANPATLAAILGAAVASVDHDRRTRR
jgi:O-antigen ligase